MHYFRITVVQNNILMRITLGTFKKCNNDLLNGDLI